MTTTMKKKRWKNPGGKDALSGNAKVCEEEFIYIWFSERRVL